MILNGERVSCLSMTIRSVNDEFLLHSPEHDSILLLNATSYEVYQILLASESSELSNLEIAKMLAEKFDIPDEEIKNVESDVAEVVSLFFENGVLTRIN